MSIHEPTSSGVATGLANLGNSCYANSIFQALAHAPEVHACLDITRHSNVHNDSHKSDVNGRDGPCVLCEVEQLFRRMHSSDVRNHGSSQSPLSTNSGNSHSNNNNNNNNNGSNKTCISPTVLLDKCLPKMAPANTFRRGVQEDSHEFLRLLIDGMQKCCKASDKGDGEIGTKMDTGELVARYPFELFRGSIKSKVKCLVCGEESSTLDPIEDLTLTLQGSNTSLTSALEHFVKEEKLEGYKCEKCHDGKSSSVAVAATAGATKVSGLSKVPPILTLHLKRFRYGIESSMGQYGGYGGSMLGFGKSGSTKIEGHVRFEEILNLSNFLTKDKDSKPKITGLCRLFAVLVHTGKNAHSGHYYAYVKSLTKNDWWRMDDAHVYPVSKEEVLSAEAYILFYSVMNHPLAVQLKGAVKKASKEVPLNDETSNNDTEDVVELDQTAMYTKEASNKRKRSLYDDGPEWAEKRTKISPKMYAMLTRASEWVSDKIEWSEEYFQEMKNAVETHSVSERENSRSSKLVSGEYLRKHESMNWIVLY